MSDRRRYLPPWRPGSLAFWVLLCLLNMGVAWSMIALHFIRPHCDLDKARPPAFRVMPTGGDTPYSWK